MRGGVGVLWICGESQLSKLQKHDEVVVLCLTKPPPNYINTIARPSGGYIEFLLHKWECKSIGRTYVMCHLGRW